MEMGTGKFSSLAVAVRASLGEGAAVARREPMHGSDLNDICRLTMEDGRQAFLKTNSLSGLRMFEAEAAGLAAIATTGCVATPRVLAWGTDEGNSSGRAASGLDDAASMHAASRPDDAVSMRSVSELGGAPSVAGGARSKRGFSFLLLSYIEGARPARDAWSVFGRELAAMHRAPVDGLVNSGAANHDSTEKPSAGGRYGFAADNFIGTTPQCNAPRGSWIEFFRECRLEPQIRRAESYFDAADRRRLERLLDHLDEFLVEPDRPSLLHGDLWSGNVMAGDDGKIWLIDPAAYVGHAEVDLAMTELFGGFPAAFYTAYREAMPMQEGYERRRDLYNLYHMLNHLNLFGRSYLPSVRQIAAEYVS